MKNNQQIIVIGDSGVFGWGDHEEGGWCQRLRIHWMRLPGAPVVYEVGIRGDGLERVAKRWESEWSCRGELRRQTPKGLLLCVGINDTAKIGRPDGRPQLSPEGFKFGLSQLLKEMKNKTDVMVMGLTAVDETVMPFANCLWYSNSSISVYESQIEETCLELDLPFLSLHKEMLNEDSWLTWIEPDGIHLNSMGHSWVYQRLINWHSLLNWAGLEQTSTVTPLKY